MHHGSSSSCVAQVPAQFSTGLWGCAGLHRRSEAERGTQQESMLGPYQRVQRIPSPRKHDDHACNRSWSWKGQLGKLLVLRRAGERYRRQGASRECAAQAGSRQRQPHPMLRLCPAHTPLCSAVTTSSSLLTAIFPQRQAQRKLWVGSTAPQRKPAALCAAGQPLTLMFATNTDPSPVQSSHQKPIPCHASQQ